MHIPSVQIFYPKKDMNVLILPLTKKKKKKKKKGVEESIPRLKSLPSNPSNSSVIKSKMDINLLVLTLKNREEE